MAPIIGLYFIAQFAKSDSAFASDDADPAADVLIPLPTPPF